MVEGGVCVCVGDERCVKVEEEEGRALEKRRQVCLSTTKNAEQHHRTTHCVNHRQRRVREKGKRVRERTLGVAHTHARMQSESCTPTATAQKRVSGLLSFSVGGISQRAEITPQAKRKTAQPYTPRRSRQLFLDEERKGGIHAPAVFDRAGFAVWVRLLVYDAQAMQRRDDEGAGRAV